MEWDISRASPEPSGPGWREWIAAYKDHRELLHVAARYAWTRWSDANWIYGVHAHRIDREAVMAYVQLDETVHDPAPFLVPGLDPNRRYRARQLAPASGAQRAGWPGEGLVLSGAVLAAIGLPAPARQPLSSLIVWLQAL